MKRRLVVAGNGMAGARFVEEVVARGGGERFDIVVFGDEPHGNYNRILLSSVLAGEYAPSDIFLNPMDWYRDNGVTLHAGKRVECIDASARCVASSGMTERFDDLVIATGSSAVVPPIHGVFDPGGTLARGIFLFRTLDDCRRILERADTCRTAAVIGGGLLGLEAAKGLASRGLDVHVIHLRPFLMETQLDSDAAAVLRRELKRMGLQIHVDKVTTAVLGGATGVQGLVFKDGSLLECDMVVVAAGIRPNVDLAAQSGLTVARGIVVGDDLACSPHPNIYAIGECAEHRKQLYGLVAPVWEQARVLADRLTGRNPHALYTGTRINTKLKVAGIELAVMGAKDAAEDDDEIVSYAEPSRGVYKKLIVRGDRIAGAIVIGDGAIVPTIRQTFEDETLLCGQRGELLFPATGVAPAKTAAENIPDTAQICDCNAVTKAQIVQAVLGGAHSLASVRDRTRACTGCGSCRPEVERIVELACQGIVEPDVLTRAARADALPPPPDATNSLRRRSAP